MGCCCPDNTEKKAQSREERAKEAAARKREAARETAEAHAPSRESIPGVVSFM